MNAKGRPCHGFRFGVNYPCLPDEEFDYSGGGRTREDCASRGEIEVVTRRPVPAPTHSTAKLQGVALVFLIAGFLLGLTVAWIVQ